MNNQVRKWIRPPEKIVEEDYKYASLDQYFLDTGDTVMNVYDIENDNSWVNDVFAVNLVNGVKECKKFIGCDFSNITLAGAFLQSSILTDSNFTNGNLVGVDFYGSDLENVDFTACDLRKVDFRKCNLKNANFSEANLAGAIFDEADLTGANFTDSYVMGAKLGSAIIDEKTKSEFEKLMQTIDDAQKGLIPLHQLPNSVLRMLDWRRMYLGGVDLRNVDMTGISLIGVNMSGTMQEIIAVPPTYVEKEEKKDINYPNKENVPRPEMKPDIKLQTEHQEFEFIEIFKEEKLSSDDKPRDTSKMTKKQSGKGEIKPDETIDIKKIKPSDEEVGDKVDEQIMAMRIAELSKRIDKVENSFNEIETKKSGKVQNDKTKNEKIAKIEKIKELEKRIDKEENIPTGIENDKNKSKVEKIEKLGERIDKKDGRSAKATKGNLRT